MSTPASFQRARVPEQKEQRRNDLLEAARRLLAVDGLPGVGLSAIAREAGVAKSNVYRYFGSREEILLALLAEDIAAWLASFEREAAPLAGRGDAVAMAAVLARTIAARPLTCELIAVVAGVLERHVTVEAAEQYKAHMLEVSIRIRNAIQVALPTIALDRVAAFVRYLHALIGGLWPMAHPSEPMTTILCRNDYAALRCDFEGDLRGALTPMLVGLAAGDARPPTG